jgi:hypothetical protein
LCSNRMRKLRPHGNSSSGLFTRARNKFYGRECGPECRLNRRRGDAPTETRSGVREENKKAVVPAGASMGDCSLPSHAHPE